MTKHDLMQIVLVFGGAWLILMSVFALAQLAALR